MTSSTTQPSVLIVEDEPLVRMLAADAISNENIDTLEAENAEIALELLHTHPEVTILFTDVDMPGMNGIELVWRASEMRPALQFIVTSGKHPRLNVALPGDGTFIAKPYEMRRLLDLVRRKLAAA